MDFSKRIAVVTGGSRGIGRGIAAGLAARGATVVITGRTADSIEIAAEELRSAGGAVHGYPCDVGSFEESEGLIRRVVGDVGVPDCLVNNAGVTADKLLLRMSPDDWSRVITTNLTGVYNMTRSVAPYFLKARKGRIVNITSVIGMIGNAGQANYAASKAGIIGLTRSLAREFASRGITVNAVAPGYIRTAMTEELSDEVRAKMLSMIPLDRFGGVEDVANVVIFLLSEMAEYITGQVINCDGGMVMA